MNRYLSIDVLRGIIMIIMALDHVIGALGIQHAPEFSFSIGRAFPGYGSPGEQWSRLLTHLCAPGFQLLAGMGLAISVAKSQLMRVSEWRISLDLLIRGAVLVLLDFTVMLPVFQLPYFFMVLACIGSCTLCFLVLRHLPRDLIGLVGLAIILLAPLYKPNSMTTLTADNYLYSIWTMVGFGQNNAFGILYPILPWLGLFAIGWWIGLKLFETPKDQPVSVSASWLSSAGVILVLIGLGLRMLDLRIAEGMPLKGAGILDPTFWQFTKYPPSWVFISLTLGVLLFLLGILRQLLDRPGASTWWARWIAVYGRTALFYFIGHFYLIGFISLYLGMTEVRDNSLKYTFPQCYLVWLAVLAIMWPVCFVYDKLRQRFRLVLRYF